MITYIKINGFKSFHNFEMEFTPLTILAGVNASGKSNLFDALELLSLISEMKLKDAFINQRGDFLELFTQYNDTHRARYIEFVVEMLVNRQVTDAWGATAELKYTRLRYEVTIERMTTELGIEDLNVVSERLETLKHDDDQWIKVIPTDYRNFWRPKVTSGRRGVPYIYTERQNNVPTVFVPQDGVPGGKKRTYPLINASQTVLSSINSVDFRHILAAKEEMKSWRFLRFNPADLREPTNKYSGEDIISATGKNLAAALFRMKRQDPYVLVEISRELNQFIPNFTQVDVIDDIEHKQYLIQLQEADGKIFSSRVLSEGTLRLLALCILKYDEKFSGLLCFEEPENGIHPFRVNDMARLLKKLTTDFTDTGSSLRQVIVNTHSPVIVGAIFNWSLDKTVSIWYSQMRSRTTDIDNDRVQFNVTKISPVSKDLTIQLTLPFSKPELKTTLSTVQKYLQIAEKLEDNC